MLFLPREDGQGLVEYALILVLVSVAVIAIMIFLSGAIGGVFSDVGDTLNARPNP
ncbi:MAG: Flp family type IVb pilin [Anaerolineales bacterium]|nr:Flp family type IVb pilin [Anaerolineales bacterium]